jgi:CRP/FNR family transcriptional regulator
MPSAQYVEKDGPSERPAGADLQSLLRELQAWNIGDLDSLYRRGSVLFEEGEPARGVYILRTGRASVSVSSSEGRVVILHLAQAGDVLGLNAVLRNGAYETTVKTLAPCRISFITRAELMDLIENSDGAAMAVIKILSRELTELMERARSLLLPQTVQGRLAQLLLHWSKEPNGNNSRARVVDKVFTHEEMAQMICSSRETVTRALAALTRREVIEVTSDSVLIHDRGALESMTQ